MVQAIIKKNLSPALVDDLIEAKKLNPDQLPCDDIDEETPPENGGTSLEKMGKVLFKEIL